MEIERFIFDTPKTCFNSVTGKLMAHDVVGMCLFANQAYYCLLDNDKDVLFDAKGQKVAEDLNLLDVDGNFYLIKNDDGSLNLLSLDGRVLFECVQNVVFSVAGWFLVVYQDGSKVLYRPDLSVAAKDFLQARVMNDSCCFFVEYEPKNWTCYLTDGTVFAKNVKDFQFFSPTFYILTFQDKTVVYDDEKHTQFVCEACLPRLMFGKKIKAVSNGHVQLYRADGTLLLFGHKDYLSFENGMILAKRDDDSLLLYDDELNVVADNVTDLDGGVGGELLKLRSNGYDYLFNNSGKLFRKANSIQLCGQCCFLMKEKGQEAGAFCGSDGAVLAQGVLDAIVFGNGWVLMEKAPIEGHTDTYMMLRADDGAFVASSPFGIEYLEEAKAWIIQTSEDKYSLFHAEFGALVENADRIVAVGNMVLVKKKTGVDIYSLCELNEPRPKGVQPDKPEMKPVWHGSVEELAHNVTFCGGDCDGGISDFVDILDDESTELHLGIGIMAKSATDDDDA